MNAHYTSSKSARGKNGRTVSSESALQKDAQHHFSLAIEDDLANTRRYLANQSGHAKRPAYELKKGGIFRAQAREAIETVFRSFFDPHRVNLGLNAIKALAGGSLPYEFHAGYEGLLQLLEEAKALREQAKSTRLDDQLKTDLSPVLAPLLDKIEDQILALYAAAAQRYGLEELWREKRSATVRRG